MKEHIALNSILASRGLTRPRVPLWTMSLSSDEFEKLKAELYSASVCGNLDLYPIESALAYSYWWRHVFNGGELSEERICTQLGLGTYASKDLFRSAKSALSLLNIKALTTRRGHHYFRTLLSQGGLPINLISGNKANFGRYKQFLCSLINELSRVHVDWNDADFIKDLNCVAYLPATFKNDSIYAISLQIAHAIIDDCEELLPYDTSNQSLKELTSSLKQERQRISNTRPRRNFAFEWSMHIDDGGLAELYYKLDCNKTLHFETGSWINSIKCYQFDIYVNQIYIGTYKKSSDERDSEDNIKHSEFRAVELNSKTIKWRDESFIEVRLVTDDGSDQTISVANCYPPNFEYPQVFDKSGNSYSLHKSREVKDCVVIFNEDWDGVEDHRKIDLQGNKLKISDVSGELILIRKNDGERWSFRNDYQSYEVVLSGLYVDWIEAANYKLLPKVPYVQAYNDHGERISTLKLFYRRKGSCDWARADINSKLPSGLIELKVEPQGYEVPWIETFYSIPDLSCAVKNATETSAQFEWHCSWAQVLPLNSEGLSYSNIGSNSFRVISSKNSIKTPSLCSFIFFEHGRMSSKKLEISLASPFLGLMVIDDKDQRVANEDTISFFELQNYKLLHNISDATVSFTYLSAERIDGLKSIKIETPAKRGIISLGTFEEIIARIFALYGFNSFDRTSAVVMKVGNLKFYIRKFVFDSTTYDNQICLSSDGSIQNESSSYQGKLLAYEIDNESSEIPSLIELQQVSDFCFKVANSDKKKSYIVFSDAYDVRRMIPKRHDILDSESYSSAQSPKEIFADWVTKLNEDNPISGKYWPIVVDAFRTAANYRLPFSTFIQLNAAVSTSKLFAKLLVAIYLEMETDLFLADIQHLEQEYAIAVHWLRPDDIETAMHSLEELPESIASSIFDKFIHFFADLLTKTLDDNLANIYMRKLNLGMRAPDAPKRIMAYDFSTYCSHAHGLDKDFRDMPSYAINLNGPGYYNVQGKRNYHYTMVNAPIRVYEHLVGLSQYSLWEENDRYLRRTINFYRRYYTQTYCEILSYMLNY